MGIPEPFTREHVQARSGDDAFQPYVGFLRSREPYASMIASNPWLRPPDYGRPLPEEGGYWDTTVGRKHPDWADVALPTRTQDIERIRHDLYEWGFALLDEAFSATQTELLRERVASQAAAERAAKLSEPTPFLQLVWALINKGEVFRRILEFEPAAMQGAAVVEQILKETLGPGFRYYSFISNIAFPDCYPQGLHQDQSAIHPWITREAPVLVNVVSLLDDVDEHNGGTLVIPGSHRSVADAVAKGEPVGALPPAINMEAPAGTVLLMDGRLLHGTGVNRSANERIILTNSCVKPWLTTQENWQLLVAPEVLDVASPKLLARLGFQATVNHFVTDGLGAGGSGRPDDERARILGFRRALDEGRFERIGELTPDDVASESRPTYTFEQVKQRQG